MFNTRGDHAAFAHSSSLVATHLVLPISLLSVQTHSVASSDLVCWSACHQNPLKWGSSLAVDLRYTVHTGKGHCQIWRGRSVDGA